MNLLEQYSHVAGADVIDHLQQLAAHLRGRKVVHINSTRIGAAILNLADAGKLS